MDRWHYLFVLGACLLITAPLEFLGTGVYRRPARTIRAVLPVTVVFVIWDVLAINGDIWTYNPRYLSGIRLFGVLPLEELLFFVVIPLCGLLTFTAVGNLLRKGQRLRAQHREVRA
ncbi:lycopene cyclase domain-containing protein [Mycobacterium sp. 21AC1]|uniref:lycopene cyclase domain-containing protein n=1 Tax=[Mycobacterium] appelbergii TaxID=2939269 RepID=UPI002938D8A5|nr:lycopene cyclase domain-containing protein [Mycobacterium sp. 21AC1]MDV3127160.1 lycopene cyclase domain-containing protein [Mycobacterium sp. 21AC1]